MKKAYLLFGLLFLLCGLVGQAFANEYRNERYGFVVNWPEGNFTVTEADNGDGILVAAPQHDVEFRAFGSKSWDVLGLDFDAGVADECSKFDEIIFKRVNKEKGWFVLSGYKGDKILHIKGLYTPETVCEFIIHYPQETQDIYAGFAESALSSFRKMDGENSALPGLSYMTVKAENEIDEHGCNIFQLIAKEDLELMFRKAVFNEEDYHVYPDNEIIQKIFLAKGERCELAMHVPESIPNYMLCVEENCWTFVFSGMDGSLITRPGFKIFSDNDVMPQKAAVKIHLDLPVLY